MGRKRDQDLQQMMFATTARRKVTGKYLISNFQIPQEVPYRVFVIGKDSLSLNLFKDSWIQGVLGKYLFHNCKLGINVII